MVLLGASAGEADTHRLTTVCSSLVVDHVHAPGGADRRCPSARCVILWVTTKMTVAKGRLESSWFAGV